MALHGKGTYFAVEDSGGTMLRDISPYLTSVEFAPSNDTHDVTTFGDEGHEYLVGLTDGSITLNGFWDKTADVGSATVLDGLLGLDSPTLGWEFAPEGDTNGNVLYSGEAVLQDLQYSSPVADVVTFTATLQISGSITKGTVSS